MLSFVVSVATYTSSSSPQDLWPVLPQAVCDKHAYCCPDAKRCLLPTKQSCAKGASCAKGQVCCPLTQICVIPGAECKPPCTGNSTYCDPDLRHCLQPTNPGVFCAGHADCGHGAVCSEITKLCVKLEESCKPPEGKPVCKDSEYCCPDAKHCLTPTKKSCAAGESCSSGQVCCPITKVCVVAGAACASPCSDAGAYCNPITSSCNRPTQAGALCKTPKDCSAGEECDPLTFVCVQPEEPCMPPVE